MHRISLAACPYCKRGSEIYQSRFESVWEMMAVIFLLHPARCHDCMQRHYRPLFLGTRLPNTTLDGKKAVERVEAQTDQRRSA